MVPEWFQNDPILLSGGLEKLIAILVLDFVHIFNKLIVMFRWSKEGRSSKNMHFLWGKHTLLDDLRIAMLLGF